MAWLLPFSVELHNTISLMSLMACFCSITSQRQDFSAVSRTENDTPESVGEVEKERERGIGEYWRNNLEALVYTRGEMYQMELKPDKSKSV